MPKRRTLDAGYLQALEWGQAPLEAVQAAFREGVFSGAIARDFVLDVGQLSQVKIRDFCFERGTLFGAYQDCVFEKGEIEDCVLDDVQMNNVVFREVHFKGVTFNLSTHRDTFTHQFQGLRFERCTFGSLGERNQYNLGLRLHRALESDIMFNACTIFALQLDAKDSQLRFEACKAEHVIEDNAPSALGVLNLRLQQTEAKPSLQCLGMRSLCLQLQDCQLPFLDLTLFDTLRVELKGRCAIEKLRLEAHRVDLLSDKIKTVAEFEAIVDGLTQNQAYRELNWVQLIGHATAEFGLTGCQIGHLEAHGHLMERSDWPRASYLGLSQVKSCIIKGLLGEFMECKSVQIGQLSLKNMRLNGLYFIDTLCAKLEIEDVQVAQQWEWKGINTVEKAWFQALVLDNQAKIVVDELKIASLEAEKEGKMQEYKQVQSWDLRKAISRAVVPKRVFQTWIAGAYRDIAY